MNKNDVIEVYYRENYNKLIKVARNRVGNYSLYNAEDAVMEAFSRACKYISSYNRGENFDKWFKGILYNCINQIKKDERSKGVTTRDEVENLPAVQMEQVVFTKEVESVLNSMSMRDQEVLNMYFFYGYKSIEISKLTSVSHDSVRDIIRRFRAKLR